METTNNFCVRFILRYTPNNNTEAFLYARISVNRKRAEISLNRSIHPDSWDSKKQCVTGSKDLTSRINPLLDEMRYKIQDCFQQLKLQNGFVTAEAIKRTYLGEAIPNNSLLSLFAYHLSSTNGLLSKGTLKNYTATEKYIRSFLKQRFRADDVPLTLLNYEFITQFELFLHNTTPLQKSNTLTNNGIMKHMERLRKIVTMAFKLEWLPKDPFMRYKLRFQRTEREFLIETEITALHNLELSNKKLDRCRDIFLFSCYTGLAYIDLANLRPDNISLGIDGEKWLRTSRQKTETKVNVPLLPQAIAILEKYKDDKVLQNENRVLPFLSNQKVNDYIKELAEKCGIRKTMTFHLARHTFATSVTLNNGIPIETVSKMLGHTKLSTTQIYVHVLDRKISDDMKGLREKFKAKEFQITVAV